MKRLGKMFRLYRKLSTDLHCRSIDWFLYKRHTDLKWAKSKDGLTKTMHFGNVDSDLVESKNLVNNTYKIHNWHHSSSYTLPLVGRKELVSFVASSLTILKCNS